MKPPNTHWPGKFGYHEDCCCIYPENFSLLLECLGKPPPSLSEYLLQFLCVQHSSDCFLGFCSLCPNFENLERIDFEGAEEVQFLQWECTDRTNMETKRESVEAFLTRLKTQIPVIAAHHFIMKQQRDYISSVKRAISTSSNCTEVIVTVDFAENYSYVHQREIQSAHWSNESATMDPF